MLSLRAMSMKLSLCHLSMPALPFGVVCLGVATHLAGSSAGQQPAVLVAEYTPLPVRSAEARRVNELHVFDGRLYVGTGDASTNTGPTPVLALDLETDRWIVDATIREEAIARFRTLDDGTLVIPGLDAMDDWSHGNIHILVDEEWHTHRTIPGALHVNDIVSHDGAWYAVTGSRLLAEGTPETEQPTRSNTVAVGAVMRSTDRGERWQVVARTSPMPGATGRLTGIVTISGDLFALPYAHGLVERSDLPEPIQAIAREPYETTAGERFLVRFADPLGPDADVLRASEGGAWRAIDLLDLRDISLVRAEPFGDGAFVVVDAGGHAPSARHLPEDADPVEFGIRPTLVFVDAHGSRIIGRPGLDQPLAVADIEVIAGEAVLLERQPDHEGWVVSRSRDLEHWTVMALPERDSKPRAIAVEGETIWVGYADGVVMSYRMPPTSNE